MLSISSLSFSPSSLKESNDAKLFVSPQEIAMHRLPPGSLSQWPSVTYVQSNPGLFVSAEPVRLGISQLSLLNGAAAENHQENSIRQIELILLLRILYFSTLESLSWERNCKFCVLP